MFLHYKDISNVAYNHIEYRIDFVDFSVCSCRFSMIISGQIPILNSHSLSLSNMVDERNQRFSL